MNIKREGYPFNVHYDMHVFGGTLSSKEKLYCDRNKPTEEDIGRWQKEIAIIRGTPSIIINPKKILILDWEEL